MITLSNTVLAGALLLIALPTISQDKQDDKLKASNEVITVFSEMKGNIPIQLFDMAQGIVIIPKLLNAGLGVAAKHGRGIAMVKHPDGSWSNPVFVSLTGGSVGFQAGIQSVELVLIVKHRETLEKISKSSFNLGGDVSVTAGPFGRNSTASTDAKLDAEIYSYSRSKGLFAGISLSGSVLDIDEKANRNYYGEQVSSADLFFEDFRMASPDAASLHQTLASLFSVE